MAEQPALNRIYVLGYSANDRDYPIVSLTADPRVAGYQVPKDLSVCPDKRYPNHVFTGAQPIAGDQRVRHVWEILPSPWVPFTRYDDDLGPIQGRRRSVKNEGQVASLTADKRTTYEAREGSAIVYTELEETWSIKVDEDGNSLFPIRDRDFYDPSRGAVQERRQLFVPTGEEVGSLENINGVITQTSYEPYNEFLSVKIVQTYKVDGPQLIGKATDNEGQLVTITTQRKAADGYVPPSPTATRTVEVNREDAESLVERIVDTPEVFDAKTFRKTREDITPQKFKAAQEDSTFEQTVEGTAQAPTLATGEFAKSEQQVNKFVKRVSTTSRDIQSSTVLSEKVLSQDGQIGTRTLTLAAGEQSFTPSATLIDASVEALGDGRTVKTETIVPQVFPNKTIRKTKEDLTPQKFRAAQSDTIIEENIAGTITDPNSIVLGAGEFSKSEEQVTQFVKRISSNTRDISSATDLSEIVITPQGQVATRTLRLSAQAQSIQPDALLVDGSIEALGDGRTVKTETRVSNVFDEKQVTIRKPENIPTEFRAAIPDVTIQSVAAGSLISEDIELGSKEIERSQERISEFRVRTTSTTRDVESYPSLSGQDYDDVLDIEIPFTRSIVSSGSSNVAADITPLSDKNSLEVAFDVGSAKEKLLGIHYIFPTQERISLPDKLISAKVIYTRTYGTSEGVSFGNNYSKKLGSSAGVTGDLVLEIEQGYQGAVPAEIHIFFVDSASISSITSKVGAQLWPAIKPKSHTVVISGASVAKQFSESSSDQGGSQDTTATASPVTTVVNIPPTIHGNILIGEEYVDLEAPRSGLDEYFDTWLAHVQEVLDKAVSTGLIPEDSLYREQLQQEINFQSDLEALKGSVNPSTLNSTTPASFPTGKFIVSSDVSLYRYGLAKVTAVVVDVTNYV